MNSTENELPAIDLESSPIPEQSLKDAQEFLNLYISRLEEEKQLLESLYQLCDWHKLAKEAHRLFGASCYVGVPAIRQSLFDLENCAKKSDAGLIANAYVKWQKEYDRLIEAAKDYQ